MSITLERSDGARLVLPVVRSERYNPRVTLPTQPIDDGSSVLDDAFLEAQTLEIDAVIPSAPAGYISRNLIPEARAFFLASVGMTFQVYTMRFGRLDDMMLQSWPHSVEIMSNVPFRLSFVEARFVESTVVQILAPAPRTSALANATSGTTLGGQEVAVAPPAPTSEASPSSMQSTLSCLLGYFTG